MNLSTTGCKVVYNYDKTPKNMRECRKKAGQEPMKWKKAMLHDKIVSIFHFDF